jgi:alkylation response protein AidB-like acyl-CoA dehydrogenase
VARRILEEGDKPAIGMTEPEAGTALTDLTTSAEKKGDTYILNGTKHWITGGGVSVTNLIFCPIS